VRPAGLETDTVKVTVPVKPPLGVTVIVDVPLVVARIAAGVTALAEIVKPAAGTVTGTLTVLDSVLGAVPVVPVTITVNPVAGNGLHETERTALLNDPVQPAGTVPAANVTVPENPLMPVTEMVEVPAVPAAVRAIVDGLADNEKSRMVTDTLVVRDSVLGAVPVIPVTTTLNGATPVVQLTESTAPENEAVQPAGTVPAVNVTVPVNPLIGVTVRVEVPVTVASVVMAGAESEKSTTWNKIEPVVCDRVVPLLPVTVTV
jgi:hypothetical protein